MLSSLLESSVASLKVGSVTDGFIFILALIFVLSCLWKRFDKHHAFTQYAPTLLTTLGILGTFFGIVAGLLAFDVKNIDNSISGLLSGMKTAFLTSLVGMLLSILYKTLVTVGILVTKAGQELDEDQIGAAELYTVMRDQRDGIVALNQAVGGGDESSLTGQMKLLRSDVNDIHKRSHTEFTEFQEKLWVKLQDFADMLSKSATETVIEALSKVITDFNTNLTEQFGQNFKELNLAVTKLVEWQENYRIQLEQMNQVYAQGVAAIADTEAAVTQIHEHTAQIPESMSKLSEVMTINQHQIDELDRHLEAFKDVRDRAVEAVPEIRQQIDMTVEGVKQASQQLVEGITSSNTIFQETISQGATEFADSARQVNASLQSTSDTIYQGSEKTAQLFTDMTEELHSNFRTLAAEMNDQSTSIGDSLRESGKAVVEEAARSRDAFESGLESMRDQLANNLEQMASQQASQIQNLVAGLKEAMEESIRKSAQSVEGSVQILDQALQAEINRTMEQMGAALASMTGKFTEDYQGLVSQMDRVLRSHAS